MSLDDILESPRLMMKLSFPPVMLQMMQEACKPEPDFAVLGKIISMDPALSTTILNLVNSPFYGLSQEISDFKRAAVVLGTRELLNLAVTVTYQKHICKHMELDGYKSIMTGCLPLGLFCAAYCDAYCLSKRIKFTLLPAEDIPVFLRCAAPEIA